MTSGNLASIPPLYADDERLRALYQYDVLDTPPEAEYDDLTRIIAHICQAPIAMISFVDRDRQYFKSVIGLGMRETPINMSICAQAILERDLLVVPDTTQDERFASNPLVTGDPRLRFYAGALLNTPEGQPLGTLCVLDYSPRDLTEAQADALRALARLVMTQLELRRAHRVQHQISAEREEAKLALERTIAAKDQFLSELSHELRAPLNSVLITASALEANPNLPAEFLEDVRTIRHGAELEGRLIDDLLDLTRISRGKVELRLKAVSTRDEIQRAVRMLAGDIAKKGLNLSFETVGLRDQVRADPARLQQILSNLLRNAIKFTPEGGAIRVVSRDVDDNNTEITVADTGIGIEPSQLPKIFNAYEQGDRSVTRRFGGLGLGLAICKGLIASHGGTIACASEGSGKGTTFTVTLPATVPTAPVTTPTTATTAPPDAAPAVRSRRILLVEDNQATARVMIRLLRHMSHEVETAGNMAAALDTAATGHFDLLISDVGLPDGSGLELMRQLKKMYGIAGIAVTGYGMEEDVRRCHEAGFLVHLTKPISVQQLEGAIEQLR